VSGKEKELGIELCCRVFRHLYLEEIDRAWVEHLTNMDHLRDGIGLRGYGQRDPLVEYKKESFALFQAMKERIDEEVVRYLWSLRPVLTEDAPLPRRPAPRRQAPRERRWPTVSHRSVCPRVSGATTRRSRR